MLETERLLLRPWQDCDADTLFKYASDPDVGPRAGWPPHKSEEESLEIIRTIFNNDRTWAIELKETGEAIGCIGYFIYGESNINIGENGKVSFDKFHPLVFDWMNKIYLSLGEKVGNAYKDGFALR